MNNNSLDTNDPSAGGGCPPDTAVIDPCVCSINVNGDVVLSCNNKNLDDSTISNILFNYVLNQGLNSPLALLNLNTNQLTRVPSGIANLPNLVGLFMDDNQVTTLPNDTTTFDPQTKLKYLSLANNQMTLVEAGALPGIVHQVVTIISIINCIVLQVLAETVPFSILPATDLQRLMRTCFILFCCK